MSAEEQGPPAALRMRQIRERLEEITSRLESEEVDDEAASELTREAAALAGEAVEEASSLLREAAD